jgi:putative colanic acid biosynthesis glycosyltransferase
LRWWSERDQGHFDAMNKGIERARGEYLIFLNAGDRFFDGEVLAKVAHELKVGTSYEWLIGDGVDLLETGGSIYKKARPLIYILHSLPSSHQAIFFHREAIGEIRYNGREYPISADYAFGAEIYQAGHKMTKYLKFPICIFALGGMSSEDRACLMRDAWKVQRDILDIAVPFRVMSYIYRYASLFLLDNYAQVYRTLRRILDQWSVPKDG